MSYLDELGAMELLEQKSDIALKRKIKSLNFIDVFYKLQRELEEEERLKKVKKNRKKGGVRFDKEFLIWHEKQQEKIRKRKK